MKVRAFGKYMAATETTCDECPEAATTHMHRTRTARPYAHFCPLHWRRFERLSGIRRGLYLSKLRRRKRLRA